MNKQVVKIVVDFKSGFGVKDKLTGNWFNPTKVLAKKLLPLFVAGNEYEVELEDSKGKDGKTYTNIVAIVNGVTAPPVAVKSALKTGKSESAALKPEYKARDFDKEARGKTMCALIEAGLQSPRVQMLEKNEQLFAFLDSVVEYGMKKIFNDK